MSNEEILILLKSKQILLQEINSLIYGNIEIRNEKYMYIHYRDKGIPITKYIGDYNEEIYNQILANTFMVKEYKKIIKDIDKKLKQAKYNDKKISNSIKNNIDFAKRYLVDTIYNQAILEGIATTFLDTENIIEGGIVNNMTANDILKIINLKHAWEFILNENVIKSNPDFSLLCDINKFVLEGFYYSAGKIRNVPVNIGGTNYKPNLPVETDIKENIVEILNKRINCVDKSIELLLYIMKKQIFIDGNKRTAIIFINHYLISNGKGIIVIPSELVEQFRKLLVNYYETDNILEIKKFLKEKCYKKIG